MKVEHCSVGEFAFSSVFRPESFRPATDQWLLVICYRAGYSRLFSTRFKMVLMNTVNVQVAAFSREFSWLLLPLSLLGFLIMTEGSITTHSCVVVRGRQS